jgi:hypothetical protein
MKFFIYFITLLFIFESCGDYGRMPGPERIEKNCMINLPPDYIVLIDEYQGGITDYSVKCNIEFSQEACRQFTALIQTSQNYNAQAFDSVYWCENCRLTNRYNQGVWYRTHNGYRYFLEKSINEDCRGYLDTIQRIFFYEEELR